MSWAGPSVIQHCKKQHFYLHSRTNKNRLVIQIQKALWRKLEPLFSRNKMLYASKTKVIENALELEEKSFRECRYKNHSKSICVHVPWPLSVKQEAKITIVHNRSTQQRKKNLIGTSSILAWGKSRVGLPPDFIAIRTR